MLLKSSMIAALSVLPLAVSAQGTPEEAYAAAVRAGACQPEGIQSAAYDDQGRVRVQCNPPAGINGGAAAGLGAVVILAALAGGGSSTTTTGTTALAGN